MESSFLGVRTIQASGTAASQIINCISFGKLAKSGNLINGAGVEETFCSSELAGLASLADILEMLREADERSILVLGLDFLEVKDLVTIWGVFLLW